MILKDRDLIKIEKPARYMGGELNSVVKDKEKVDLRFAFCFPDTYEVGMSHLGIKILYHILNNEPDIWCERVFAPWTDMEALMREKNQKLFALESLDEVDKFDVVGFTLQYEMSYTNVLNMLDLAGIPLRSVDRGEEYPIVCAGGPCAYNPEPLAPFIDFFMLGEGEEQIVECMNVVKAWKKSNAPKLELLKKLAKVDGVYVPEFYDVEYNQDGTIKSFFVKPEFEGIAPEKIKKVIIKDLDKVAYPEDMVVPFIDVIHDRITLELFRGCIRGCRFCQAGFVYRPVREKKPETLLENARKLIKNTGYEELGLMSLSTSDYTCFENLIDPLLEETKGKNVSFSLPSLRIDSFSLDVMERAQKVRKSGLTFAPEAGTQRLRDVINKGVNEQDLFAATKLAFEGGWNSCKLYFMIGLPTETDEDVAGIAKLAEDVVHIWFQLPKEKRRKALTLSISASSFVPKPFTPFQWEAQDKIDELRRKQQIIKENIKSKAISYKYHESLTSSLEGVVARGDRKIADVIELAWEKGAKFDSWDECFKYDAWTSAFDELGISQEFYANRKRDFDEVLPWDHIDIGVSKKYLEREAKQAYKEIVTPNCREKCMKCGSHEFCAENSVCNEERK